MKVVIGADHGGFPFISQLAEKLEEKGITVINCGPYQLDPADDYPPFAFAVGEKVVELEKQGEIAFGVLLCRSGAGVTVAANKVKGVRATQAFDEKQVIHAREHDSANVLTLSGDWLSFEDMWSLTQTFIATEFSGDERHKRRIGLISSYERA